jgi:selenide,water dikinase
MTRRLTEFSHGAGCACKLDPSALVGVLDRLTPNVHPDLLVDAKTGDDAAVYRIAPDRALVLTTDFFTPLVDDPFTWGRLAATNAVSDVYAMGGRPLLALNIVAWNTAELAMELLGDVLAGADSVARDAGFFIVGGHSVDDPEPKYGLATPIACSPTPACARVTRSCSPSRWAPAWSPPRSSAGSPPTRS